MADLLPFKAKIKTFSIVKCAESAGAFLETAITSPASAAAYLRPLFDQEDSGREHFAVLFLNTKQRPIAAKILFSGSVNEAAVYPREIARAALLLNAKAVIVAHNHPSGEVTPSAEDIALSRRIKMGLALLDIQLHDSLVLSVGDGRYHAIGIT